MSTPADEVRKLAQARIGGTVSDTQFHTRMAQLGPLLEANLPIQPSPGDQALQALSDLRDKRLAGTLSAAEFFKQSEGLAGIAYPEAAEDPEMALVMRAPTSPSEYRLDLPFAFDGSAAALKREADIRKSLFDVGMPQIVAGPWFAAIQKVAEKFSKAPKEQIQKHTKAVGDQLRAMWGPEYQARSDRVFSVIAQIDGEFGEQLAQNYWWLADVSAMSALDAFATHKHTKR